MKTFFYEFLTRGTSWLRIIIVAAIMPVEKFASLILLLSIEGMITAISSYPTVKDVLVRQDIKRTVLLNFIASGCIIYFLTFTFNIYFGFIDGKTYFAAVCASIFNGATQIALNVCRLKDLQIYNTKKGIYSSLTFAAFVTIMPLSHFLLFIVYALGAIVFAKEFKSIIGSKNVGDSSHKDCLFHVRGGIIYGSQAIMTSIPQHGIRIFISAVAPASALAWFTKQYMLVTSIFFIYSAISLLIEPKLSKSGSINEVRPRLRSAIFYAFCTLFVSLVYFIGLAIADYLGIVEFVFDISIISQSASFFALCLYACFTMINVIANSLVLALGGRFLSLVATALGTASLILALILLSGKSVIFATSAALMMAQLAEVIILIGFLAIKFRSFPFRGGG